MAAKQAVEIQESTPLAEIARRPDTIKLFGHPVELFNEMCVHFRNGYRPHEGVGPDIIPNGYMSVLLQLGDPMPLAVQRAKATIEQEQRAEHQRFEMRVQEEAARRVAANAQAELDARIAAAEAVAEAEVARIRAEVAAERARIEAAAQ